MSETRDAFLQAAAGGQKTLEYPVPFGKIVFHSLPLTERIEKVDMWMHGGTADARRINRTVRILQLVSHDENGQRIFEGTDEEFEQLAGSHAPWVREAAIAATNFLAEGEEDESKN